MEMRLQRFLSQAGVASRRKAETLITDGPVNVTRRGAAERGTPTQPAEAQLIGPSEGGNNTWFEVALTEGKNRQIHRMCEALGLTVAKLRRVSYAGLELGDLRPGRWRRLEVREVTALRKRA